MVNIAEWSKTANLLLLEETLAHKVLNAGAPTTIYPLTLIHQEEGIKKSHPESTNISEVSILWKNPWQMLGSFHYEEIDREKFLIWIVLSHLQCILSRVCPQWAF